MLEPPPDLLSCTYSRLSAELVDDYLTSGQWREVRLDTYLRDAEVARPDHVASIDKRGSEERLLTYREYAGMAWRIARGLTDLGVTEGDVVTVMLPNCSEFGATIFAISSIQAVYSGIPSAYGQNEAVHMLTETASRVLVMSGSREGRDFVGLAQELLTACPLLETVVMVGLEGDPDPQHILDFDHVIDVEPLPPTPTDEVGSLAHIGFTSGTTSMPKGVLNTHETLDSTMRNWVNHIGVPYLDGDTVTLVASPIGHHAGFVWGVLMTAYLQGTAVHMARWNPSDAAELVARHGVTAFLGAPAFLIDLLGVEAGPQNWRSLRLLALAGAPIPRSLMTEARERFGCFVCPAWGMTELGLGISASPTMPVAKVDATDGYPIQGCEVRVIDSSGETSSVGVVGDLQIRGSSLFAGYLRQPAVTEKMRATDGWFDTGDRAHIDSDGHVTLSGRTKDLVIRGGENIPVAAVEDVLYQHPAVQEIAIVGIPDERLGERACACVVAVTGPPLTLGDITDFLRDEGVSKHFWPEKLCLFEELPRTPSGKVRKVELREEIGRGAGG